MTMYAGWRIARWETPVVDVRHLLMVSLVDDGEELVMLFEAFRAPGRPRWRVRFQQHVAYRNIDEAYRLGLWRMLDDTDQRCGFTFTVEESPPLDSWSTEYLHEFHPTTRHYVIATEDDVVEVLTPDAPVWEIAEPAAEGAPLPGKSRHYYAGEDDDEIQRVKDEIKRRRPEPRDD